MVSDLHIYREGAYLRELFSKYEAELAAASRPVAEEPNEQVAELIMIALIGKGRTEEFACLPGYQPPNGVKVLSRHPLYLGGYSGERKP